MSPKRDPTSRGRMDVTPAVAAELSEGFLP